MAKKRKVLCIQDKDGRLHYFAGDISDPRKIVPDMEVGDKRVTSVTNKSGTYYVTVAESNLQYRVAPAEISGIR